MKSRSITGLYVALAGILFNTMAFGCLDCGKIKVELFAYVTWGAFDLPVNSDPFLVTYDVTVAGTVIEPDQIWDDTDAGSQNYWGSFHAWNRENRSNVDAKIPFELKVSLSGIPANEVDLTEAYVHLVFPACYNQFKVNGQKLGVGPGFPAEIEISGGGTAKVEFYSKNTIYPSDPPGEFPENAMLLTIAGGSYNTLDLLDLRILVLTSSRDEEPSID